MRGAMTMQELFRKYGLRQRDLTRALARGNPSASRSYAHYIWHGVRRPSLNAIMAIRQAYPAISEKELLDVVETGRG